MTYFEETKKTLDTRIKRLNTKTAWAEDPPPRTRRFITNIVIENVNNDNEIQVRSNYLVTRSRAEDVNFEQFVGEKLDILRKENGIWKIASRTIIPDQAVLNLQNLSMIL
jgi:3-phenylpropionate/cinnamic acid dioxygenase small subunit